MWNLIEGVVSSCFLVISWSRILIQRQSTQHRNIKFPVCQCMLRLKICAHCSICHIWCFGINMTSMWHHCNFICCIYVMWFLVRPSDLSILALILEFFQIPITPGYQWWMYAFSRNTTLIQPDGIMHISSVWACTATQEMCIAVLCWLSLYQYSWPRNN